MKNKIRFKTLLVILAVLICVPLTVLSHSGRTDESGGHRDNRNVSGLGSYHYHHGYPAHLHENGVCPYGGGTAVKKSSGSNRSGSGSGSSSRYKSTPKPTPEPSVETRAAASITYELNYDAISVVCIVSVLLIVICVSIHLLCRLQRKKNVSVSYKPYALPEYKTTHAFRKLYTDTRNIIVKVRQINGEMKAAESKLYFALARFLGLYNKWTPDVWFDKNGEIHSDLLPNDGYIYTSLHGKSVHYQKGCSGAETKHNFTYVHGKDLRYCKKCCKKYYSVQVLDLIKYRAEVTKAYRDFINTSKCRCNEIYPHYVTTIVQNMSELRELIMKEENIKSIIQHSDDYNSLYKILKEEHEQTFDDNIKPFPNDNELKTLKKRFDEQINQQQFHIHNQDKKIEDIKNQYKKVYFEKNNTILTLEVVLIILAIVVVFALLYIFCLNGN